MASQPSQPPSRAIQLPEFMPIFWLSIACVVGIFCADSLMLPTWVWASSCGFCSLIWLFSLVIKRGWSSLLRRPLLSRIPPIVLAAFLFLGGWCFQAAQITVKPDHVSWYNDKGLVELNGVIILPPEVHSQFTYLTIKVETLSAPEFDPEAEYSGEVQGKVLVQVLSGKTYQYGQHLSLRGKLQAPPDGADFSYRDYLQRKGILSLMAYPQIKIIEAQAGSPILAAIYQLKQNSQATLYQIFPSPEAELLSGILLGDDKGISSELEMAYQASGTAHIIAISGFNITLLAGIITATSNRLLGARKGILLAIFLISAYTILVGAEAAVVRAAIMGSLGMLGVLMGRRNNGLNILGLTALGMCLLNPQLPWDVGFQLSFMATLGLVIYAQPLEARLQDWLSQRLKPGFVMSLLPPLSDYLLLTLIAQIMVLPLLAYHFGRLSWLFLLANPLILPVQPLVMILGGVALLAGLVSPAIGHLLAYLAWPFAAYTNRMVEWLVSLFPNTQAVGNFSVIWIVLFFTLLFSVSFIRDWKPVLKSVLKPTTALFVLGCSVITVWALAFSAPDGRLSMVLIPSNEQPVVFVQSPSGRSVLINASTDARRLSEHLSRLLPFGTSELDVVIIPSCKRDDVIGLIGLNDHVNISQVYWVCEPDRIQTTKLLYQAFESAGVDQRGLFVDDYLDLGEGASLKLLESSDDSKQFSVIWKGFSALLLVGDTAHLDQPENMLPNLWVLPNQPVKLNEIIPPGAALVHPDHAGWFKVQTDGLQLWASSQK